MYFVKKNNERSLLDDFSSIFTGGLFNKELKTDIEEAEDKYNILVDVPGVDKKDIDLKYHDEVLTISVNQTNESCEESKSYLKKERCYHSVSRSFYLANGDDSNIKAKLNDGVLSITINKLENISNTKKNILID